MKKGQFKKEIWAIIVATALTEAVCGKKNMKRIVKRLNALNSWAVAEVWFRVYNAVNTTESVHSGDTEFENMPIVKEESLRILKMIRKKATTDTDYIYGRMKKIIICKFNKLKEESK